MADNVNTEIGTPDHGEKAGLPQLDTTSWVPQLIWLVLSFVFLYVFLSRAILPKLGQVLEERRDRIADDLDKAAELKKQTDEAIAGYEAALAQARGRAHAIAQEMRDQLSQEMDEQRKGLDAKLAEQLDAAEARIEQIKQVALANVQAVASDVAEAILEKLTGSAPDQGRIAQAVKDTLPSRDQAA